MVFRVCQNPATVRPDVSGKIRMFEMKVRNPRYKTRKDQRDRHAGMERARMQIEQNMSKRKKHSVFLKALILHGDAEGRSLLQEKMQQAERDELCAWRALWLVSLLAAFSCCGICYSAVLIPEFFQNSSHIVVKIFSGLGLASVICAIGFLSFWLWCRGVLNRTHEDCRRFVMATLEPGSRSKLSVRAADDGLNTGAADVFGARTGLVSAPTVPTHQTYSQLFSLRRSH